MTFRVGMEVICVDAKVAWFDRQTVQSPLVEGQHYHIREVFGDSDVTLEEVAPPKPYEMFRARRFRPVVKRKTDISVFEKLLKTKSIEELVE